MEVKENAKQHKRERVGNEKENFAENLAALLSSGMDSVSALAALKKEAKSGPMKRVVETIETDIMGGSSLSAALEKSGLFSPHIMALIKTGEESGRLSDNLKVVVSQLDKERVFKSKVASAMTYPVFVLFLTTTIGVGLAWFVLPKLASVFASLNLQMPLVTKILISIGNFLGKYGMVAVPAFLAVISIVIYFVFLNHKTNSIGQRLLFHLPGVKQLMMQIELAQFGYILGNLLNAGLPVVEAFESLEAVSGFVTFKKMYRFLREEIEKGNSFARSFEAFPTVDNLIPITTQQMIIAAEQSGYLADTLIKIGQRYEEKTDTTTKDLSVILEPIMLLVVALGVFAVAISVILPIYSLVGGLTSGQSTPPATAPTVVETVTPTATPTPTVAVKTIQVEDISIGYLNVRQSPSTTATILGRALPGDIYEFFEKQDEWYKIKFEGNDGWVNGAYVTEK